MTTLSNHPTVSVVIPTYNHARFLKEAIESVRAQSFTDWEVIVINNNSEDNTVEVVEAMADPRVRLIDFRNNGIIAASRNKGIELSEGKYIAFLDSDDKWYPNKLQRCVALLDAGRDVVCHAENWVWEDGKRKTVAYGPARNATYRRLLFRKNCLSTSAVVARRATIARVGGFDEDPRIVTVEDYDLWLRIARVTDRLCFPPETLGEYRIHGGNSSKAILRQLWAERRVLERHFQGIRPLSLADRLRCWRRVGRLYLSAVVRWLRSGRTSIVRWHRMP